MQSVFIFGNILFLEIYFILMFLCNDRPIWGSLFVFQSVTVVYLDMVFVCVYIYPSCGCWSFWIYKFAIHKLHFHFENFSRFSFTSIFCLILSKPSFLESIRMYFRLVDTVSQLLGALLIFFPQSSHSLYWVISVYP